MAPKRKPTVSNRGVTQDRPLTPMQEAFIDAYMRDGHATNAALSAGYAKSRAAAQACNLLKNSKVRGEIDRRRIEIGKRVDQQIISSHKRCLERAERIAQKAEDEGKFRDALAANDQVAKLGDGLKAFYPATKMDVTSGGIGLREALDIIEQDAKRGHEA